MKPFKTSLGLKLSLGASLVLCVLIITLFSVIEFSQWGWSPRTQWWFFILFTVIITAATVFTFVHYMVERPLRSMRQIMQQTENRHFLLRIPVTTYDVIGDLGKSFNRMLQKVTTLDAFKLETERELIVAQEELKYKK